MSSSIASSSHHLLWYHHHIIYSFRASIHHHTSSMVYSGVKASQHLFIIIIAKKHKDWNSSVLRNIATSSADIATAPVAVLVVSSWLFNWNSPASKSIADTQCCNSDATADIASASSEKRDYRMFSSFFPASGGLLFVYDIGFPVHQ